MLLENEAVDSVESTFAVSHRPLGFWKVLSGDKHLQTNIAPGGCYEKLRQRYAVISWNTISTGRVLHSGKSWAAVFSISQPVDVLVQRPYGPSLLLLAPDHRWCFIYSCKINQTAMSVPILASHHQNKITELKQWRRLVLRCAGNGFHACVCAVACVRAIQERLEQHTQAPWRLSFLLCDRPSARAAFYKWTAFTWSLWFLRGLFWNAEIDVEKWSPVKAMKCFLVRREMAHFPQGDEL